MLEKEPGTVPQGFITEEGQQDLRKAVECISAVGESKKKKVKGMHYVLCRIIHVDTKMGACLYS